MIMVVMMMVVVVMMMMFIMVMMRQHPLPCCGAAGECVTSALFAASSAHMPRTITLQHCLTAGGADASISGSCRGVSVKITSQKRFQIRGTSHQCCTHGCLCQQAFDYSIGGCISKHTRSALATLTTGMSECSHQQVFAVCCVWCS